MIEHLAATLLHGFELFRAETAQLPLAVLAWMWAMRIVLGASIVFLRHRGALVTFGTMLATAVGRFYIKGIFPEIPAPQIGASVHVVLWLPLLAFLLYSMRAPRPQEPSRFDRAYATWRGVAAVVLAVSLVFDVREVVRILS